jgi:hypothetical protein
MCYVDYLKIWLFKLCVILPKSQLDDFCRYEMSITVLFV